MAPANERGSSAYGQRIKNLGESKRAPNIIRSPLLMAFSASGESLEVSYQHLKDTKAILTYFLPNSPAAMLEIFDEATLSAILVYCPSYKRIRSKVHVRISALEPVFGLGLAGPANLGNRHACVARQALPFVP